MWEIFKTFFVLGCISFGGPAAHIGYFRETFVQRLAWLSERQYAEFVALSQFLPGPGSSQVGFAIGYHRLGLKGACSAFLGFTLPSIVIMLLLVISAGELAGNDVFQSVIHGLKLLAVVVVFDAVLLMYKNFCQGKPRILLCLNTACTLLISPGVIEQILVLIFAAIIGVIFLQDLPSDNKGQRLKKKKHCLISNVCILINYKPLIIFLLLLLILPLFLLLYPATNSVVLDSFSLFSDFFQAGSLVFGGGHVVLPLLQNIVEGQVTPDQFLTGYAIAQAIPGPMFTLATYIGYFILPSAPIIGSLVATLAVFLPGFLLLLSCLKNWKRLAKMPNLAAAINGVNAAVVGLLISALYQPVFVSAVFNGIDMAVVLAGFYLLKCRKLPIMVLVFLFSATGALLGFI